MMDAKHDDETPAELKKQLYRKPGWNGVWYRDVRGGERCALSWVGPCPYCHSRENQKKTRAELPPLRSPKETVEEYRARVDRQQAVPFVPYYEVAEVTEAAERAHAQVTESVEAREEQYVYVWDRKE